MKHLFSVLAVVLVLVFAQGRPKAQAQGPAHWQADLTQPQPYVLKRVSSADPTGGNADFRSIEPGATLTVDRKSTRLNSSHVSISYAVFCLKKKKKYYYSKTINS